MKKIIVLSLILIFNNCVFAFDRGYFGYGNSAYQRAIMRPRYNPYSYNSNNAKKIEKINKIRKLNRLKNNIRSWSLNQYNNRNNGVLTGYSLPIQTNTLDQFDLNSSNIKENFPMSDCNTNLFSTPSGSEYYFNDGRYFKNFRETTGKTGVTIIYD